MFAFFIVHFDTYNPLILSYFFLMFLSCSRFILVIKTPSKIQGWTNYTREFTYGSWGLIFVFFVATCLLMQVFTRYSSFEKQHRFSDTIITSIGIFCNMGRYAKQFNYARKLTVYMDLIQYSYSFPAHLNVYMLYNLS